MSHEQLSALYSFIGAAVVALLLWLASKADDQSRTARFFGAVLGSWFLSTRWSMRPRARLKVMAGVAALIAILMLVLFFADPPPRYTGN